MLTSITHVRGFVWADEVDQIRPGGGGGVQLELLSSEGDEIGQIAAGQPAPLGDPMLAAVNDRARMMRPERRRSLLAERTRLRDDMLSTLEQFGLLVDAQPPAAERASAASLVPAYKRLNRGMRRVRLGKAPLPAAVRHRLEQQNESIRAIDSELVGGNARLVLRFCRTPPMASLTHKDLIRIGVVGLVTALARFTQALNSELSTYAVYWIRQTAVRARADYGSGLRLPVHEIDRLSRMYRAEAQYWRENGHGPALEGHATGTDASDGLTGAEIAQAPWWLVAPVVHQERPTLGAGKTWDRVWDTRRAAPAVEFRGPEVPGTVVRMQALLELPLLGLPPDELTPAAQRTAQRTAERRSTIICGRWAIGVPNRITLEELGQQFFVTRERIRQIQVKLEKKLTRASFLGPLTRELPYLDDPLLPAGETARSVMRYTG